MLCITIIIMYGGAAGPSQHNHDRAVSQQPLHLFGHAGQWYRPSGECGILEFVSPASRLGENQASSSTAAATGVRISA
jgi:hypothetical protein|eukprot:COSAG06_NODE_2934_length_6071_cov_41.207636_3_plen_78_part_00